MKRITQREKEILQYFGYGFTLNEIADRLFLSIETVRSHKKNIYRKLDISTGVQLGMWIERNINNPLRSVA